MALKLCEMIKNSIIVLYNCFVHVIETQDKMQKESPIEIHSILTFWLVPLTGSRLGATLRAGCAGAG